MPTNATPKNWAFGTDDQSNRMVYPEPLGIPQHIPLFMLNTPKGDYKRHVVNGGELLELFGSDVFGANNKYTSHATVFAKMLLANGGGKAVIQRLKPRVTVGERDERDANVAGITYYLATTSDNATAKAYDRNANGTIKVDASTGVRLLTTDDITARTAAVVTKYNPDLATVITELIPAGTDGSPEDVTLTPIFSIKAEGHGEEYNNYGISLSPKIGDDTDLYERDTHKGILYDLRVYNKSTGVRKNVKTITGDTGVDFSLRKYASTKQGRSLGLTSLFPGAYGNYVDPLIPISPLTFDKVVMHDDSSFENILKELLTLEIATDTGTRNVWEDYSNNDDAVVADTVTKELHLVNFASLKTTSNIGYEAIRPLNTVAFAPMFKARGISISIPSTIIPSYLSGGEDGEVDNLDHYEANVISEMDRYMDASDRVQSLALNKETIIYDTGLKFENKLAFAKFIGKRRDTNVVLSTYTFNKDNVPMSIADEYTIASSLGNILKLYPESDRFGTPTSRASIVMHSGFVSDGTYAYRLPNTLDLAVKLAKFAGAGNGAFDGDYEFSRQPNNQVSELIDIEPYYIPDTIKDKLYSAGLVYLDNEDEVTFFYPSTQTVYDDSTSVLNDIIENIAIGTVVRIAQASWRRFSGVKTLSNIELKIAVEKEINDAALDKFNGQIVITPEVYYTPTDLAEGSSWSLRVGVAAYNAKTVQKFHTIALRREN